MTRWRIGPRCRKPHRVCSIPSIAFFLAPLSGILIVIYMLIARRERELPYGPWLAAAPDSLDGWDLVAAKTLSDGRRRILLGSVRGREGRRGAAREGDDQERSDHMAHAGVLLIKLRLSFRLASINCRGPS